MPKHSCHFSILTVAMAALFQIAATTFSLSNMGWRSPFPAEQCGIIFLLWERDLLFYNPWDPVPPIEIFFLKVRCGRHVDNLPLVFVEVDEIPRKQLLLLCWKLPWWKDTLVMELTHPSLGRSGLAVNMGKLSLWRLTLWPWAWGL